jgi:spore maturation protein CgeB
MKALLWWSGAAWSVSDVASGIDAGLTFNGVEVAHYRTNHRIVASGRWLHSVWRRQNKLRKQQGLELLAKPSSSDAIRHASDALVTRAWRLHADWVICVSGLWIDPDALLMLRQMGIKVALVCTESPYETAWEAHLAQVVDHVWTNERTCVPAFQAVCPSVAYLRHAWHPAVHTYGADQVDDVPAHDVVFVGTGFPERTELLRAVDWTGIDLGLYGYWTGFGSRSPMRAFVKSGVIDNRSAAALYRRARVGLNLHRTSAFAQKGQPVRYVTGAESLNPRAYELAACGLFFVSDYRAEVGDVFGTALPTFTTPTEAGSLIRQWLRDEAGRAARAAELRACVAGQDWHARGAQMVRDLRTADERRRAA